MRELSVNETKSIKGGILPLVAAGVYALEGAAVLATIGVMAHKAYRYYNSIE
ncbi:hypothetical protein SG34_021305 [Thalassomonas viridans]|uniref:Uncharacterized protein n=1 Tax=Thalassomonas viridans TaxID=137584 RepID=A0AAE9YZP9_9GAMM|nr:hypothetical protein [Thalassomonas viridans]WDE03888.1 hypothetical protein SG34_021305 [Thalassomonas viridans]